MIEIMDKCREFLYKGYLVFPFIVAFLFYLLTNVKNSIGFRRITKVFCIINFIFATFTLLLSQEKIFEFFNINFETSKTGALFIFCTSILFLITAVLSKTFIKKFHKIFYLNFITLIGLTNLFFLTNNVFVSLFILFWIFTINYLFYNLYIKAKEHKKEIKKQYAFDFATLLVAAAFILFDFSKFFITNGIEITYLNIKNYISNINEISQMVAFFGFLLVACRIFNFIPNFHAINQIDKIKKFIVVTCSINLLFIGCYYFIEIYASFTDLFFKFQNIIAIFILVNMFCYMLLSLRKDNILKIPICLLYGMINISFFVLFSFDNISISVFIYSFITLIFAFLLTLLIILIAENKVKVLEFNKIGKAITVNKKFQYLFLFSLLNIANVPLLAIYTSTLPLLISVFTTEYESNVMDNLAYFMVIGLFIACFIVYRLIYKTFIEPSKKPQVKIELSFSQSTSIYLLIFLCILFEIFGLNLLDIIFN